MPQKRLSTGVAGLDTMIGGGLLEGDSTLIAGSPGTGKTTLGMHFLAAGVEANEPTIFVTFEYLPQQIYRDAAAKGMPVETWEREDKCLVLCTTPEILAAHAPGEPGLLDTEVARIGARRVVIDSVTHFTTHSGTDIRPLIGGLLNRMRLMGVTPLLTHELPQIVGPTVTISPWGIEFVVDNVLLLRYVEIGGEIQKAVSVLKFRGGDHDRKFRRLRMTQRGIAVEAPFDDVENITTGSARHSIKGRAEELV